MKPTYEIRGIDLKAIKVPLYTHFKTVSLRTTNIKYSRISILNSFTYKTKSYIVTSASHYIIDDDDNKGA